MSHNLDYEKGEKCSMVAVIVNGLLFIFKIFAGVVGHSNAMIADAFDTLGDVMTSGGMIIGFRIAKRPPDADHPYGHGKAESIIAKLLALFLILLGLKVAYDSIHVMVSHNLYVPGRIALIAAVVSIIVKLALFKYMSMQSKKISSTSLMVYSWNIASDAFSSFAALIGIAGARLGFPILDPIAALVLSVFIIRAGFIGFHKAYDELMDGAPSKEIIEKIRRIASGNKMVRGVKDVKVRKMGLDLMVDMIIEVDSQLSVENGHSIAEKIKSDILKKLPATNDVLIHIEPFK